MLVAGKTNLTLPKELNMRSLLDSGVTLPTQKADNWPAVEKAFNLLTNLPTIRGQDGSTIMFFDHTIQVYQADGTRVVIALDLAFQDKPE